MLKTIALVIVVAIAGVLIFAATKPDTFAVSARPASRRPRTGFSRSSTTSSVGMRGRRGRKKIRR
jgi:hypothetical protein